MCVPALPGWSLVIVMTFQDLWGNSESKDFLVLIQRTRVHCPECIWWEGKTDWHRCPLASMNTPCCMYTQRHEEKSFFKKKTFKNVDFWILCQAFQPFQLFWFYPEVLVSSLLLRGTPVLLRREQALITALESKEPRCRKTSRITCTTNGHTKENV